MRTPSVMAIGFLLAFAGLRAAAGDSARGQDTAGTPLERRFRETVRPFLETYCLGCHGKEKPKGDLDLSAFTTADVGGEGPARAGSWSWSSSRRSRCRPRRRSGSRRPRPARTSIAWIGAVRKLEAKRNAGDPGPVPARRLSNAEYDHTDPRPDGRRPPADAGSSPSTRPTRPGSTTRPNRWRCRRPW